MAIRVNIGWRPLNYGSNYQILFTFISEQFSCKFLILVTYKFFIKPRVEKSFIGG